MLWQVQYGTVTAGFAGDPVTVAAPILRKHVLGLTAADAIAACRSRGWRVEEIMSSGRKRGEQLAAAILATYEASDKPRRPNSLRMGAIGKSCSRALWYNFRWADAIPVFGGRMLRLFDTGKREEDRIVAELRRLGANVIATDPDDARKQIAASAVEQHHNGFLDSVAQGVPFALSEWIAAEYKTHSVKSFKKLQESGVAVSKPEHFSQLQSYLREHQLLEGLYVGVCKDTDDLYCEFIPYDAEYAARLLKKAEQIVFSEIPPEKIHRSPEFFTCRFCDAAAVCHKGALPERNCRTCLESKPVDGGKWHCGLHGVDLSFDQQLAGCDSHRYKPTLVPGRQTDVQNDRVIYEVNGQAWADEGRVSSSPLPAAGSAAAAGDSP